jgi:ABC-type branched-subunit amino acid transport system substrate-binding protein
MLRGRSGGWIAGLIMTAMAPLAAPPATAADKDPVVMGVVTGLSGEGAEYGQHIVAIVQMYIDTVNAAGGIDGRKVEAAVGDSEDKPDVLISLGKRYLNERKVTAFFGTGNSGETLAFEKAMKISKVPIMMNYTWGNANTSPAFPSAFRIGPYNAYAAALLAKYLAQAGYKKAVIVAEESAYGTDFAAGLKQASEGKLSLQVIPYAPQILDLGPVLLKLAHENPQPDALVTAGNFQIIYNLQNQVPESGLKSQIVGSWDYPTTQQYWKTAGKNGIGIIYATFTAPSVQLTPTGQTFKGLFAAKFKRDPYFYEYFLWDCLNAVRTGVEKTHSVDHAVLSKAIADIEFEGTMGPIKFVRDPQRGLYNQALIGTLYMKQFTALNQTDADAKVIAEIKP